MSILRRHLKDITCRRSSRRLAPCPVGIEACASSHHCSLGMWHPFAQVVWDHEFDPLNRMVTASLTTIAAPSYSLPAVVLGRDWATTTVGTELTFNAAWSGLASFTAQLGQARATVFGGLVGVNYALRQAPAAPIV